MDDATVVNNLGSNKCDFETRKSAIDLIMNRAAIKEVIDKYHENKITKDNCIACIEQLIKD